MWNVEAEVWRCEVELEKNAHDKITLWDYFRVSD